MPVNEVKGDDGKTTMLQLKLPSGAECEIYTFGATLTKFKTSTGTDLIWLSTTAKLDGTKAIRGGIPLVFPQFGAPIKEMAQHGFARNNNWNIDSGKTTDTASAVSVCLSLDNTMATHEAWPFPYKLEFEVTMNDESLTTVFRATNTGKEAFKFQSLQHTYLNIGDISKTTVKGLERQRFLDKTAADPTILNIDARPVADITDFTDRVYVNVNSQGIAGGKVVVNSPNGNMSVAGSAYLNDAGSIMPSDTVMWNPWAEKAKGMGDFDDDGYLKMLCIEPGLIADFHMLPPNCTMGLTQVLKLEA